MKFENLKLALDLNKDEPASLTLAFYMMQSIVKDIEQESGVQDFRSADIGDVNAFTGLLGNQLRVLLRTYKASIPYIQGNLTKLAQMEKELETAETELKKTEEDVVRAGSIQKELEEKRAEKERLDKELEGLQSSRNEYERLCRECDDLRKQTDSMEQYDIPGKKKEKDGLQKNYDACELEVRALTDGIGRIKKELNDLDIKKKAAGTEKTELESKYRAGSEELKGKQHDLEELRKKLTANNQEIERLKGLLEELKGKTNPEKVIEIEEDLKRETEKYEGLLARQTELEKECSEKRKHNVDLQKAVEAYEKDQKDLDKILRTLKHINDPEFKRKAALVSERTKAAVKLREALESCAARLKEASGGKDDPVYNELHEELTKGLEGIDRQLDRLAGIMTDMSQKLFNDLMKEK